MAIETGDLLVLQKSGGGELRKATVQALLSAVPSVDTPTLDEVTTSGNNSTNNILVGSEVDTKIALNATSGDIDADGDITADGTITGNIVAATAAVTAGTTVAAVNSVSAGTEVFAGAVGTTQIKLDGATGEVGGGADVFIDGGAVSLGGDTVDYA